VRRARRKKSVKGPVVDPVVVAAAAIVAEGEVVVVAAMALVRRAGAGTTTTTDIIVVSQATRPMNAAVNSPSRKKNRHMRPKRRRNPHFSSLRFNPLVMVAVQTAGEMRASEHRGNVQIPLTSKPEMACLGRRQWVLRRSGTPLA
jgi:hypothetical protein